MRLKPDELAMLNGEEGELRQEAMKFLVRLGEVFGAEEMVDIEFAFPYTFNHLQDLDSDRLPRVFSRDLLQKALEDGVRVKIPSIGALDGEDPDVWEEMGIPPKLHEQYLQDFSIERRLGINAVSSCTPYLVVDMNVPPLGVHMITTESSATPYYNSVLGARCERCGISALFAALTGKYPAFGFHMDENRYATIRIDVTTSLTCPTDFGCLGQFAGELCGMAVPVITGVKKATNPDLIALSSAIATGGAVSLFHIPGVTPEFRTMEEALNYKLPVKQVEFGKKELDGIYQRFSADTQDQIHTVMIGCPHLNIYQMGDVAMMLKDKKVAEGVKLIINTNPNTKFMGNKMGYVDMITQSGALLIAGTCPIICNGKPGPLYAYTNPDYSTGTFATDSLKAAAYAKSTMSARRVVLGSWRACINAALTGKWGGDA